MYIWHEGQMWSLGVQRGWGVDRSKTERAGEYGREYAQNSLYTYI